MDTRLDWCPIRREKFGHRDTDTHIEEKTFPPPEAGNHCSRKCPLHLSLGPFVIVAKIKVFSSGITDFIYVKSSVFICITVDSSI